MNKEIKILLYFLVAFFLVGIYVLISILLYRKPQSSNGNSATGTSSRVIPREPPFFEDSPAAKPLPPAKVKNPGFKAKFQQPEVQFPLPEKEETIVRNQAFQHGIHRFLNSDFFNREATTGNANKIVGVFVPKITNPDYSGEFVFLESTDITQNEFNSIIKGRLPNSSFKPFSEMKEDILSWEQDRNTDQDLILFWNHRVANVKLTLVLYFGTVKENRSYSRLREMENELNPNRKDLMFIELRREVSHGRNREIYINSSTEIYLNKRRPFLIENINNGFFRRPGIMEQGIGGAPFGNALSISRINVRFDFEETEETRGYPRNDYSKYGVLSRVRWPVLPT